MMKQLVKKSGPRGFIYIADLDTGEAGCALLDGRAGAGLHTRLARVYRRQWVGEDPDRL